MGCFLKVALLHRTKKGSPVNYMVHCEILIMLFKSNVFHSPTAYLRLGSRYREEAINEPAL
jgi:hypothetical protein